MLKRIIALTTIGILVIAPYNLSVDLLVAVLGLTAYYSTK